MLWQGLTLSPAVYDLGQGGNTIGKGEIIKSPLVGRHVKKVKQTKYWIFKSKKKEQYEVTPPIVVNNVGDEKVRFCAIDENGNRFNVDLTGLVYSGNRGTLQIVGQDATLARPVLNNRKSKSSNKPFVNLPAVHDLLKLNKLSATLGLKHESQKSKYQTLGSGSIEPYPKK